MMLATPDSYSSPPPGPGIHPLWWGILYICAMLVLFGAAVRAKADDLDLARARAKAAIEIARVPAIQPAKPATAAHCHMDPDKATAEAVRDKKALVLWVGITCADHMEFRKLLDEAVHCHVPSRNGTRTGVVVKGGDGNEYWIAPANLVPKVADKVKAVWALPPDPPTVPGAKVREEISKYNEGIGGGAAGLEPQRAYRSNSTLAFSLRPAATAAPCSA